VAIPHFFPFPLAFLQVVRHGLRTARSRTVAGRSADVADFLLGAGFVALMITPAIVGRILRGQWHKG
jgi:hypothetical protein